MRIGVLAQSDSWYLGDLRRAAGACCQIIPVSFRELTSQVDHGVSINGGGIELGKLDALVVRTMPPGSLEQIVFRMDALGQLEAAGIPIVNPPRSLEAAVDKYLALARIAAAGIEVPPTIVCQDIEAAMAAFDALGGDVVVKPLFGSEGRGIARINDTALARRAFGLLAELKAVIYLQKFIEHEGFDLRILLVGGRALAMRRRNPSDWRTNISRGAVAEPVRLESAWLDVARRAATAVGAPVAGVDLLPAKDGCLYAIEVNAVPGWKALAEATQTDVARLVLDYVESIVESNRR